MEACEGILTDSEAGKDPQVPGGYDHLEDYTFTVCVPNSPGFTLTFEGVFALEQDYDFLHIYDGADKNAPLIGSFTGTQSPGTITTSSSCVTFHFISDANVSAAGFSLTWDATPPEPTPPVFDPSAEVDCESTSVQFTLDQEISCTEIKPENFQFNGPSGSGIQQVNAINCQNGKTKSFDVVFNSPLNESGRYYLNFSFTFIDICGNVYFFEINTFFDIINCPLKVDLKGGPNFCEGGCINLFADAKGGNPATYSFDWNNGTNGPAVRKFCPQSDTIIYVEVSDASPSPSAKDSIILTMIPSPTITPGPDTLCRNDAIFNYNATPVGGFWEGQGFIDTNAGTFRPSKASNGWNAIVYHAPNGCTDTVSLFILPINAGPTDIACVSSASFKVRGGNPGNGFWSGSVNIDAAGNYTPSDTAFTDTVTYHAPNGCKAKKLVKNVDSVTVQLPDTLCINDPEITLNFNPFGGVWSTVFTPSGNDGITNNRLGSFNPGVGGAGTHQLQYDVFGCFATTSITIIDIHAGADQVVCPQQDTFNLTGVTPPGGYWTGLGIIDSTTGLFDPGFNNNQNFNTTLNYSLNGCVDQRIIYVFQTAITQDTLSFCPTDAPGTLGKLGIITTPGGGIWQGTGISSIDSITPGDFDSTFTYVYYTQNTCTDSLLIEIYPHVVTQNDTVVCPVSPNFNLNAKPTGGIWSGFGIVDSVNGTFSPPLTGRGSYFVQYELNGCSDLVNVTVDSVDVFINDHKDKVCHNNTPISLSGIPGNGKWFGNGFQDSTSGEFIPTLAGPGWHTVYYQIGSGACAILDSSQIFVRDSLSIEILPDSLGDSLRVCFGEELNFYGQASGGYSLFGYEYNWKPKGERTPALTMVSDSSRYVVVAVSDQCSKPASDSVYVQVESEITYTTQVNSPVCYGSFSWGTFIPTSVSNYNVSWLTNPPIDSAHADSILHGRYQAIITNLDNQCQQLADINIPSYPYLNANFDFTPKSCLVYPDTSVYFINMSTGVEYGTWYFELDTLSLEETYQNNSNPIQYYADSGKYDVQLTVFNGNGTCSSTMKKEICVEPQTKVNIPSSFTPNNDGINDVFPSLHFINGKWLPKGIGIQDYEMKIFDRWGKLIYELNGDKPAWNGGFDNDINKILPQGVYVYQLKLFLKTPIIETSHGKVTLLR